MTFLNSYKSGRVCMCVYLFIINDLKVSYSINEI